MIEWIHSLMNYPGIAFLMFLENVVPVIPSELIMPLAGFEAKQAHLSLWGVILTGTFGAVLGQVPLYYLGSWVGKERLKRWAAKHGDWLAIGPEEIDTVDQWFQNHGTKAVLIGRVVPGIRGVISLPAGFARMHFGTFLAYTSAGTLAWIAFLAWLGSLLGDRYEQVERYMGPVTYVVVGAMTLWFIISVIRRKRAKAGKNAGGPDKSAATA